MRQELAFNGKALSDFGVWFDGSVSFGSPERDVELVEVVGRNGALSISNDRFRNIEITFPCAIRTNFIDNYRNLMAFLNSSKGYCRLETTQEPNYYRLALFMNQTDPTGYKLNTHGRFDLVFQVMPQRFLKTGENWTTVSSSSSEISGNPVTVDNPSGLSSVNSLSVALNPSQELNGYDAPWVGGAGKNKLKVTATTETKNGVTFTVNDDGSVKVEGTPSAPNVFFNLNYASGTKSIPVGEWKIGLLSDDQNIGLRAYVPNNAGTAWGMNFQTVTVEDDASQSYVRLQIASAGTTVNTTVYPMILPSDETDTSFAPYENICPITGHSSASVMRTGKNLYWLKAETKRGLTLTANDNGTYNLTGEFNGTSNNTIGNSDVVTLKAGTYILNSGVTSTYYGIQIYNNDSSSVLRTSYGTDVTFTISADTNVTYRIWITYNASMGSANVTFRPMLRPSGTTSDFEPYNGNTYTIDLNGTRYGGTLDVLTGVLTVTWGTITLDGSESWKGTPSNGWYTTLNTLKKYKSNYVGAIYADKLVTGREQGEISGFYDNRDAYPTQNWLYYYMNTFTSANEVKSYFQTNPTQIVYELATPFTYNLTPQQISLLTGTNIISTDMDSLTVTIASPAELENPTLFESKPIIRVYGNGTLNVNDIYITVANSPYAYIDIDCELMDCYHGSNNANQYVSFSTTDYVTLKSRTNYFTYSGFTKVEVTPRWFEV